MKENIDYIVCPFCNKKFKDISAHIRTVHNITIEEFKDKYPNYPLLCQNTIDKIKTTKASTKEYRSQKAKQQFLNGERKIPITNGKGLGGIRPDLDNQYFRCMWEANFARILKLKNIDYEYEKKIPIYDENNKLLCTYLPDFYLPQYNSYIELKGKWENNAKEKTELFKQYYPNIKYVIIEANQYNKKIYNMYHHLIPLWESRDQNIKNKPELYNYTKKDFKLTKFNICPVCKGYYNKLHLHFTKQNNQEHLDFYNQQKEIIKNLFNDLNFNKNSESPPTVIFNYKTCVAIWHEYYTSEEIKERTYKYFSKIFSDKREAKNSEEK